MALPNKVLPGFSASIWMQSAATPAPLSTANLSVWVAQVTTIVGTSAGGTGSAGVNIPVEAVPAFGSDDSVASYSAAGSRQSDKIPMGVSGTSKLIRRLVLSQNVCSRYTRAVTSTAGVIRDFRRRSCRHSLRNIRRFSFSG